MRLTLRALLAYRNDAGLRSRQKKEIRDRIKKSDNAATLLRHLKVITSDPGVAPIESDNFTGSANPNKIAQYLDSSMPDELVEQFEKDCLASPSLLAEVTNCHAILARVYRNETVPVPPDIRQRIYSLSPVREDLESMEENEEINEAREVRVPTVKPEFAAQETNGTNGTNGSSRTTMTGGRKNSAGEPGRAKKPAKDGSELPGQTVSLPVALIGGVILLAVGLAIGWAIASGKFSNEPDSVVRAETPNDKNDLTPDKSGKKPNGAESKKTEPEKSADKKSDDKSSGKSETGAGKGVAKADSTKKDKSKSTPPNKTDGGKKSDNKGSGSKKKDAKKNPANDKGKKSDGKDKKSEGKGKDGAKKGANDKGAKPVVPNLPVLARISAENQVAIRKNVDQGRHFIFGAEMGITPNQTILTIHGTQTVFETNLKSKMTVHGAAKFHLRANGGKSPIFVWHHGLAEFEASESKTIIEIAGKKLVIESTRPDTVWWLNARRFATNRDLSDIESRVMLFQAFVGKGQIRITDGKQSVVLSQAHGYEFTAATNKGKTVFSPVKNGELASRRQPWEPRVEAYIETGLEMIAEKLQRDKPLETQLTKFTEDLRFQVVTISTQMFGSLGYYQPLLQLLDNESNLTVWSRSLEAFRYDLANNDDLVKRIDQAFAEADASLHAMLVGINEKQLTAGGDEKLVGELSSNTLARRVLAIENLHRITGRTFLYRPDVEEATRRPKVRSWLRDLKAKKIRYAEKIKLPLFVFNNREKPDAPPAGQAKKKNAKSKQPGDQKNKKPAGQADPSKSKPAGKSKNKQSSPPKNKQAGKPENKQSDKPKNKSSQPPASGKSQNSGS